MIDLGSSGIKVSIISERGQILVKELEKWQLISSEYGIATEVQLNEIEATFFTTIKRAFQHAKIEPHDVSAISVISQRIASVFLDDNGNEVYIGLNNDSRGLLTDFEYTISPEMRSTLAQITGLTPTFLFAPLRYWWFKEKRSELAKKVKKIMTLHDWAVYKLTNKIITEPSVASATMLLDIHKRTWSKDALDFFKIEEGMLPEIKTSGEIVGELDTNIASALGLPTNIAVVVGGGDTNFGLLANDLTKNGDYGLVVGYTTPVMAVTDNVLFDSERKVWSGCHSLPNKWVIESNLGVCGGLIDWFCENMLFNGTTSNKYEAFKSLFQQAPIGAHGVKIRPSTVIMDAKNLTSQKTSAFIAFPSPILPHMKPVNISDFARALLEGIIYAIRANIEQIKAVTRLSPNKIGITGGLLHFSAFPQMIADTLNSSVYVTAHPDGSQLACAAVAFKSTKHFSTLKQALKNLIATYQIKPEEKYVSDYNESYMDWIEFYKATETWMV